MARWVRDVYLGKPDEFVHCIMQDFLQKNGFQQKDYKGELLWQEGMGMLTPPKFFKYSYVNGTVHIETWMKTAWLPGVYTGENAIKGFIGALPKKIYREDLERLLVLLNQPLPTDYNNTGNMQNGTGGPAQYGNGTPGQHQQAAPGQPVYVEGVDNSNMAVVSLALSLLSIVGLCIPLIGIIFGAIAITYGNKARGTSKNSMAMAGIVIGIIMIIISIITYLLNLVLGVSALF